jgi:hypothetical protein
LTAIESTCSRCGETLTVRSDTGERIAVNAYEFVEAPKGEIGLDSLCRPCFALWEAEQERDVLIVLLRRLQQALAPVIEPLRAYVGLTTIARDPTQQKTTFKVSRERILALIGEATLLDTVLRQYEGQSAGEGPAGAD